MDFTQAYREFYPSIFAFLCRRVPAAQAEELTAETFARAWKNFHTVQGQPLPWLYGVARNVMREYYRKRASLPDIDSIAEQEAIRADFAAGVDMSLDINRALLTLSAADREILTLHAWEGLTTTELAQVLEISGVNARVKLHRARTRLAQALENES